MAASTSVSTAVYGYNQIVRSLHGSEILDYDYASSFNIPCSFDKQKQTLVAADSLCGLNIYDVILPPADMFSIGSSINSRVHMTNNKKRARLLPAILLALQSDDMRTMIAKRPCLDVNTKTGLEDIDLTHRGWDALTQKDFDAARLAMSLGNFDAVEENDGVEQEVYRFHSLVYPLLSTTGDIAIIFSWMREDPLDTNPRTLDVKWAKDMGGCPALLDRLENKVLAKGRRPNKYPGARDSRAEDSLLPRVAHSGFLPSTGAGNCVPDSLATIFRLFNVTMTEEEKIMSHHKDNAMSVVRSRSAKLHITKDLLKVRKGEDNLSRDIKYHVNLPSDAVYFCIASSHDNQKHAFAIDTRRVCGVGRFPVLLDSSLSSAVRYSKDSMSWVKVWQSIYKIELKQKAKM
jgi:hypothetical protein